MYLLIALPSPLVFSQSFKVSVKKSRALKAHKCSRKICHRGQLLMHSNCNGFRYL